MNSTGISKLQFILLLLCILLYKLFFIWFNLYGFILYIFIFLLFEFIIFGILALCDSS